ncbi:hypothetical protein [Natronocalculus amylovorans]|uniref:GIY-YIG domain-containing protein n=1 Tax=Natronocalculus amylovorans TaxID=2917812 RepID=A0AAE3K9N3_9EURY|nr:hypothetical protein [Natronocalculus amylovorans]MCL9817780.1 hypothetical protein [Natronocalculus amylovorans]
MAEINWSKVPQRGGVYCMYDLDENPVYVGYASESDSRSLLPRLREHFTQQNSSVVAHGRIDLLDVWYVEIWISSEYEVAEEQLIAEKEPVFNRGEPTPRSNPIDTDDPDEVLYICDNNERETRLHLPNRIRSKMDHIQRMVDSDQIALEALSRGKQKRLESARNAAQYHLSILESAIERHYEAE